VFGLDTWRLTFPARKDVPPLLRSVRTPLCPLSPTMSTMTLPEVSAPEKAEVTMHTCVADAARQVTQKIRMHPLLLLLLVLLPHFMPHTIYVTASPATLQQCSTTGPGGSLLCAQGISSIEGHAL
jgi:hypothetical protein